jgi:S-DNA-T family DNA segregation ATPase FtsK/SpoIIIE
MASLVRRSPQSGRSLASPAVRQIIGRRFAELAGLGLGLGAIVYLLALASYNAADPSLNTATAGETTNLVGPTGAIIADILLQLFGLAAALPGVVMLAWAWRVAAHRGVDRLGLRLGGLMLAMPVLAATLAELHIPGPDGPLPWPVQAGLGGAAGAELGAAIFGAAHDILGPTGTVLITALGALLSAGLTWVGSAVSLADWRAARAGAAGAARGSFSGGRRAASVFTRWGQRTTRLLRPILGRPIGAVERNEGHPERTYHPPATPTRTEPMGPALQGQPATPEQDSGTAAASALPQAGLPRTGGSEALGRVGEEPLQKRPTPPVVRGRIANALGRPNTKPSAIQEQLPLPEPGWRFPSLSLLAPPPPRAASGPSAEMLQATARMLESVLADYGVQGIIKDIRPGPVVTLYELEPAPGIRSARVIGLADDIARSLSVTAVRIATVPGRNVIGIELPNAQRETVFLADLLGSDAWHKHPGRLTIALGKDISGAAQIADLSRMPHLLVAGTTGSGKSVGINAMILSLLYRLSPEHCRMILIDPKMLELSVYEGIPHLMAPVVTEPAKAVVALKWTVREMERRYRAMSQLSVRNIGGPIARRGCDQARANRV